MRRPSREASVASGTEGRSGSDHSATAECEPAAPARTARQSSQRSTVRPFGESLSPGFEGLHWLSRTIESEIIPRLMLAHCDPSEVRAGAQEDKAPPPNAAEQLAMVAIGPDPDAALEFVRRARAGGLSLEAAYLELLTPAARHLGALWDADLCPFTEVTVGLWRLQRVMHELGASFCNQAPIDLQSRRAMLVPVPGSQHTMGWFMLSQFFLRAGWDVQGDAMYSEDAIVSAVRGDAYDLVGFTLGADSHLSLLRSVILRIRKASRNRRIVVMIGGPVVLSNPGLVGDVGADATAPDGPRAVALADSLCAERSMPS